ncbi:MAG: hypothetical protein JWO44_240 [Bacteroidetes bacterium]|nr:hypothetical protein [Bacteroidota bacterium]
MNRKNSASDSSFELGLILTVSGIEYRLDGTYKNSIFSVQYSRPVEEAADLGTVADGLIALGNVLLGAGKGKGFYQDISNFIGGLPSIFEKVSRAFLDAHVVITRLEIKNGSGSEMRFAVGLGLLFKEKVSVGGIVLEYFTFEYEGISGSKTVRKSLAATAH